MNNIEKFISKILLELYPGYEKYSDYAYYKTDDQFETLYSFDCPPIAGKQVFRSSVSISHIELEKIWFQYKEELMCNHKFSPATIFITPKDYQANIKIDDIHLNFTGKNEEDVRALVLDLFTFYDAKVNAFKSIAYCDKILNATASITPETLSISEVEGLPFRKALVAQAANNPNLKNIIDEMRKYCNEQYELGKKENFEKLCKLKPVFEKLFGNS